MKHRTPDELYNFINHVILELQAQKLDAKPLQDVQITGYTTSSEWLGELGKAVREVQKQKIEDGTISSDLLTIMLTVHKVWPHM
jgi:hypothetical protein